MAPINLEAHAKAHKPAPNPGKYALDAADELEAMLAAAESLRTSARDYDYLLSDLSRYIGDEALAELDGPDVEYIARCTIARLRAKGAK